MNNSLISNLNPQDVDLGNALLKKVFLEHLNSIYCGKEHLLYFLEEISEIASLKVLQQAIDECRSDTLKQMEQMDEIFLSIKEKPSKISILGMKAMTLEAYISAIKSGKTALERDVFIVFYLQIIEGIEITYFKVLKNLAKEIGYKNSFIEQPFDIAVDNKILFESIYKDYIS